LPRKLFPELSLQVNRPLPDAAYGPSPIISSRRHSKQIDLWMDTRNEFAGNNNRLPQHGKIKVDRWRPNV
jgi:hypothetical protein